MASIVDWVCRPSHNDRTLQYISRLNDFLLEYWLVEDVLSYDSDAATTARVGRYPWATSPPYPATTTSSIFSSTTALRLMMQRC